MIGKVVVEGDRIRLCVGGRLLDEQSQKSLTRIYDVYAGSDIDVANLDSDFCVFVFTDKIWVLPRKTEGVSTIIYKTWKDFIEREELYYNADLEELPRHWRRTLLWGFVRLHEPQLLVLPSTDIPHWRVRGPSIPGKSYLKGPYPHLDQLIGGWFHQDFDIEGETLEQIISSHNKVSSAEDRQYTRSDIQKFLQERDDRQVKEDLIRLFHPDVDPEAWGMSTRQWLQRIYELLQ